MQPVTHDSPPRQKIAVLFINRRKIRALQTQLNRDKKKFGEIVKRRTSTQYIDLKSEEALEISFSKLDMDGNDTVDKEELKLLWEMRLKRKTSKRCGQILS